MRGISHYARKTFLFLIQYQTKRQHTPHPNLPPQGGKEFVRPNFAKKWSKQASEVSLARNKID